MPTYNRTEQKKTTQQIWKEINNRTNDVQMQENFAP